MPALYALSFTLVDKEASILFMLLHRNPGKNNITTLLVFKAPIIKVENIKNQL
jgi:hypothetical protein